jgi:serine/threonine-protein kinase RsbW
VKNRSSKTRRKVFRGIFKNLAAIGEFIRQSSETAGLTEKDTYQVETAVDEACSNIIEHAYGGEDKGDIICCCVTSPGTLSITLADTGKPFNPSDVAVPDTHAALEKRESHGLGLFFINQMMDEVHFDFSDPKVNVLVMTKRKG